MVAVTYGVSRVRAAKASAKPVAKATSARAFSRGSWMRWSKSRLQQAQREIAKHAHLFPSTTDESNTPFGGW